MGSNASKNGNDTAVHTQKSECDVDANGDPRSPTPEVARTPLKGTSGARHNITKNMDLRKTFENNEGEEKLIHNNPILSAVIKNHLQSYDPRSPTQDFERTPIIITSKEVASDKNILCLKTDNNCASPSLRNDGDDDEGVEEAIYSPDLVVPKNLCKGFLDLTLNDTLKDTDEPLGSSTASNEAIEENICNDSVDKPTKLLETNFDYVENEEHFEDSEECYDDLKTEVNNIKAPFKILENDPRSPSTGIERTPIVVSKIEEVSKGENVEEMSDDSLIKVLQSTNIELRQTKSLDNNEMLIYEDEVGNLNETPKKSKSLGNSAARTPLSCMKNKADTGHSRSNSANTVFTKGQNKVQKRVSHIPRLKSLTKPANYMQTGSTLSLKPMSKGGAISGDCENTPPQSHRDRWDKDSSIVL